MKIAYRKNGWRATDIRFVDADYSPVEGEFIVERDVLPSQEELSGPKPLPEVAAENIVRLEIESPITHRSIRELILAIGEIYPAGKNTVFYQRAVETETAVRAERAKL